ncbi:DNA phosphorothioation-dependent restriction protein DptG [Xenorhabdus bovienii]|uniref:DNA phosphorothioation-dependent restriction protein DptG n=1 Tax=Xenorhabdus bovienii TaxID=40576 RepID=UPI0023B26DE7|nr:DNA phosphorothioation-dependent restriction protein DptG [Xenorhabdus bovienii]MDE9444773.1 DNA phosphorothioation-dependent restriction protein DptG [Xenorhabdus bovienii]
MDTLIDGIKKTIEKLENAIEQGNPSIIANKADVFLPIGPGKYSNEIEWSKVYSSVVHKIYGKKNRLYDFNVWKKNILDELSKDRKTKDIVNVLSEIYLGPEALKKITPLAYLFSSDDVKMNEKTKSIINLFHSMILYEKFDLDELYGNNFLEKLLISKINDNLIDKYEDDEEKNSYLPFLSKFFTEDLRVLLCNTQLFLKEFETFLKLYSFLYLSQLSLHLEIQPFSVPKSEKLYFILESERASKERINPNMYGYYSIFGKNKSAYKLFPYLSYLTRLNSSYEKNYLPLWKIFEIVKSSEKYDEFYYSLNKMNLLFNKLYEIKLDNQKHYESIKDLLEYSLELQLDIFYKSNKNSKREGANQHVVNTFKEKYCDGFYKLKGPSGYFFELKPNIIMLLTKLIIGKAGTMLIDDVIQGFRDRGIWLDEQSKKALIIFYERIGNVEKMSDSGDAVYVKSEI